MANGGISFPTSFGPAQSTLETTAQNRGERGRTRGGRQEPRRPSPYRADQLDADGVGGDDGADGRVPIDGTVNDPYPFKVLVGPDNLTANGIDIPDAAGPCSPAPPRATGRFLRARPGAQHHLRVPRRTIRTIPEDREGNQQNNQQRDDLGWISDPHGIPCVSGERRSNARSSTSAPRR